MVAACATQAPTPVVPVGSRADPVVYGDDDRLDWYQVEDPAVQRRVRNSIVALVDSSQVRIGGGGAVQLFGVPLGDALQLCPGEPFESQPAVAFCSGTLVDDDIIVTAGHCLADERGCRATRFVFDFFYEAEGRLATIDGDDVYGCGELLVTHNDGNLDFAFARLDRPVVNRMPARVRSEDLALPQGAPVTLVGFPGGVPVKIDGGGHVIDPRAFRRDWFQATMDAFGGNSGSGVFDADGRIAGILSRGATDYVARGNCLVVNRLPEERPPFEGAEVAVYMAPALSGVCSAHDLGSPLCERSDCDECDLGEARCDGDGIQRCGGDDTCPRWGDVDPCRGGERCVAGACLGPPDAAICGVCEIGARRCAGAATAACVADVNGCGAWAAPRPCDPGGECRGGQCFEPPDAGVCGICEVGEARCVGGAIRGCLADARGCGQWGGVRDCRPGETCRDDACEPVPDAGLCGVCRPGEGRCRGRAVEQCVFDDIGCGLWSDPRPCEAGAECIDGGCVTESDAGVCGVCEIGARSCARDDIVAACVANGQGCGAWTVERRCPNGPCVEGVCPDPPDVGVCGVCEPGAGICLDPRRPGTCVPDDRGCGNWRELPPCAPGTVCDAGGCAFCNACEPGAVECRDATTVRRCEVDDRGCREWRALRPCDRGMQCIDGACAEPEPCGECTPGDTRCRGDAILTCLPDALDCGRWTQPRACLPGRRCVDGSCALRPSGDTCEAPTRLEVVADGRLFDPLEGGVTTYADDGPPGCGVDSADRYFSFVLDESMAFGARLLRGHEDSLSIWSDCDARGPVRCASAGRPLQVELGPGRYILAVDAASAVALDVSWRPLCVDPCELGAARCEPDGQVIECRLDDDSCTEWTRRDCPAGTTCDGGRCRATCRDHCDEEGEGVCADDGRLVECVRVGGCLVWDRPRECAEGRECRDGLCSVRAADGGSSDAATTRDAAVGRSFDAIAPPRIDAAPVPLDGDTTTSRDADQYQPPDIGDLPDTPRPRSRGCTVGAAPTGNRVWLTLLAFGLLARLGRRPTRNRDRQ